MKSLLVALVLSATGQKVGTPVEFDVSARKVTATGSTTARALRDRFSDVVNVKDFGAIGNGVADDTAAIQAAIDAGKPAVIPPGTYRITSSLVVGSAQALRGLGAPSQTFLRAAFAGPVVKLVGVRSELRNLEIDSEPGFTYAFVGVQLMRNVANTWYASQIVVENVVVTKPDVGIKLTGGVYYAQIRDVTVYQFNTYGIRLEAGDPSGTSTPADNRFFARAVQGRPENETDTGRETAAVYCDGNVNEFHIGQPTHAMYTAIFGAGTYANYFYSAFGEHTQKSLKAGKRATVFWNGHSVIQGHAIDDDARVYGPHGQDLTYYNNFFQRTTRLGKALGGLYLFNEGAGSVVIDHSGNGRHLLTIGTPLWTENGRWGKGLQFDYQGGQGVEDIFGKGVVDWAQPFTVGVLVRKEAVWNSASLLTFRDAGGKYLRVERNGYYLSFLDYNGSTTATATAPTMDTDATTDGWTWVFLYIDPVAHTITSLDPNRDETTVSLPFATWPTMNQVTLMRHGTWANGLKGVISFLGFWQRKLTWGEVLDLVNAKTPTLWPERSVRTVKELAFARDGSANEARHSYGTAAPAAGTWRAGDIIWNAVPAAGGAPGWMCVAGGTPGTWKAMANLAP